MHPHDNGKDSAVLESLPPLKTEAYMNSDNFSSDALSKDQDTVSGFFFEGGEDLKRRLKGKWPLGKTALRSEVGSKPLSRREPSYRYAVEGDEVVDMVQLKKRTPRAFERLVDQRIERGAHDQMPSNPSRGGGYLSDGFFDDSSSWSLGPKSPTLKAFLYCVRRDEVFAGLWALDLADRIEFVSTLGQADVLIHRRPKPGEKQFSYQDFLSQARELGVPFVSINEPSKKELRASLTPVFELYDGRLPFDLDQMNIKGKPRRIRI